MTFQYFDSAAAVVKKHFWRQNLNRRKTEIQIFRETEVCQFGKTISARVLKSFPAILVICQL